LALLQFEVAHAAHVSPSPAALQLCIPGLEHGKALGLAALRFPVLRTSQQLARVDGGDAITLVTARVQSHIEPLGQGAGLFAVDRAYEHLLAHNQRTDLDLHWKVSVPSTNGRGIYLRATAETARAHETSVNIEAVFKEQRMGEGTTNGSNGGSSERKDGEGEAKDNESSSPSSSSAAGIANAGNLAANKARVQFQRNIALECAVNWVDAPKHLALMHGGRAFSLVVHGEKLEPGLHYTEIRGFDADLGAAERAALGPLFRVPVTVCKVEDAAVAHSALVASSIQGGCVGDLASVLRTRGVFDSAALRTSKPLHFVSRLFSARNSAQSALSAVRWSRRWVLLGVQVFQSTFHILTLFFGSFAPPPSSSMGQNAKAVPASSPAVEIFDAVFQSKLRAMRSYFSCACL
jgi:hypothetical protein